MERGDSPVQKSCESHEGGLLHRLAPFVELDDQKPAAAALEHTKTVHGSTER
jgi:hypothetical protein